MRYDVYSHGECREAAKDPRADELRSFFVGATKLSEDLASVRGEVQMLIWALRTGEDIQIAHARNCQDAEFLGIQNIMQNRTNDTGLLQYQMMTQ